MWMQCICAFWTQWFSNTGTLSLIWLTMNVQCKQNAGSTHYSFGLHFSPYQSSISDGQFMFLSCVCCVLWRRQLTRSLSKFMVLAVKAAWENAPEAVTTAMWCRLVPLFVLEPITATRHLQHCSQPSKIQSRGPPQPLYTQSHMLQLCNITAITLKLQGSV